MCVHMEVVSDEIDETIAVMVKRGRRTQERSATHVCNFMLFDEFACMCHLHV